MITSLRIIAMNYLEQINRAIDFIEQHLDEELIVSQISQEAGISKWHFQRVFKAVLGETVKGYTLSRRLSLAAQELLRTDKKIVDIALSNGFESHEVFSRAFKQTFKSTPSEFRSNQKFESIPTKLRITKDYIEHLFKGINMQPKIVKLPAFVARGVSAKISDVNGPQFLSNFEIIPKLWNELKKNVGDASHEKISMIDSDLIYFAGVICDEESLSHLECKEIPDGEYAEFLHVGPMSKIDHTMNYIYGSWFPNSEREREVGPDLSLHTEKTNPMSSENEVRILIPLKKDSESRSKDQ